MSDAIKILTRLKEGEDLYVLMSGCTRNPYVECDPETFDDYVIILLDAGMARAELERLHKARIPVSMARMVQKQRMVFYTSLYTMGVNAMLVKEREGSTLIQVADVVKRMDPSQQKEGTVWIENPQLHLTSLYFMQRMRSGGKMEMTEELAQLQEEMSVNFGRGNFLVPLQKEGKGIPLIRMGEEKYQPVFTDILEFQKFNRGNVLRPVVVSADRIPQVLVADACGVVLNPMGVNVPLRIERGNKASAVSGAASTKPGSEPGRGSEPGQGSGPGPEPGQGSEPKPEPETQKAADAEQDALPESSRTCLCG